ncbi:type III-A CRISPR-associated protein Csm2 [Candidatus Parcubacteria bacterium]|nr:MAG: type III-A CRISPR-associated protein Csm2 [Candidatus Parcubacteria bacterium]
MASQHVQRSKSYRGHYDNPSTDAIIADETLKKIIVSGNAELMVKEADRIGKLLVKGKESDRLSTSQIRAIFGEVRKIQGQVSIPEYASDSANAQRNKERAFHRLYLLIPKMRYRVAKEKEKPGIKRIVNVLEPAIRLVLAADIDKKERDNRFNHFVEFFEAILAYHRAYGGK